MEDAVALWGKSWWTDEGHPVTEQLFVSPGSCSAPAGFLLPLFILRLCHVRCSYLPQLTSLPLSQMPTPLAFTQVGFLGSVANFLH